MGFPPELWFEEGISERTTVEPPKGSRDIVAKVEHLFAVIKNQRMGEPYTNAEVARMSAGDLTEEEVKGIRSGRIPDPSMSQGSALAGT